MDIKQIVALVMQLWSGQSSASAPGGAAAGGGMAETAKSAIKALLIGKLAPRQHEQLDRLERNAATDADKAELRDGLDATLKEHPDVARELSGALGPFAGLLGGEGAGGGMLGKLGGLLGGLFK